MAADVIIWIFLLILFIVAEAVTIELVSVWFVGGALAALLTALLQGSVLLQCIIFLSLSLILLIAFRPLFKKKLVTPLIATNLDMVIGRSGTVIQRIDNDEGTGRVNIGGQQWPARSYDAAIIEAGTKIRVHMINGATLIVYIQ